jgi:excisionase family DNA binding protein
MTVRNHLTLAEVARELDTSIHTVRQWIKSRRLASVRPGRYRLVERSQLEAFLRRNARGYQGSER